MTREQGIDLINQPQSFDPELVEMVKKRLGFSDAEFEAIMNQPQRTYRDFKTIRRRLSRCDLSFGHFTN
jgi:hypothetical protein